MAMDKIPGHNIYIGGLVSPYPEYPTYAAILTIAGHGHPQTLDY